MSRSAAARVVLVRLERTFARAPRGTPEPLRRRSPSRTSSLTSMQPLRPCFTFSVGYAMIDPVHVLETAEHAKPAQKHPKPAEKNVWFSSRTPSCGEPQLTRQDHPRITRLHG